VIIHGGEDGKIRGLNSEIPVKFGPYLGRGYFDHKFMITDGRVAITGSLNWSGACMSHNLEDVLITSEDNIVARYVKQFDEFWKEFGHEKNYKDLSVAQKMPLVKHKRIMQY